MKKKNFFLCFFFQQNFSLFFLFCLLTKKFIMGAIVSLFFGVIGTTIGGTNLVYYLSQIFTFTENH